MIQEPSSTPHLQQTECKFQLDVDIKITGQRPLFQTKGKIIHEVKWINQRGQPIVLLQINGPAADQEASFFTRFSNHPNIIETFGRVRNNSNLVMLLQERAPKPDLSEMLREHEFRPTERVLWTIFEQICDAMLFLSHSDAVHGDLACRNVLVFKSNPTQPKENLVKLTDFGLTRDLRINNSANSSETIIPIRYAAPELLKSTSELNYSEKSDVYSMGVLMWEACSSGEIPYGSVEKDDDVRRQKLNDERPTRPSFCSDQLWTIINKCLHINPRRRLSFKTLKQRLLNLHMSQSNQQPIISRPFRSPFVCLSPIPRNRFSHANIRDSSQSLVAAIHPRRDRSSSQPRRASYDRASVIINDEIQSVHSDNDSEQEHRIRKRSESYNRSNRQNRPVPCHFCQEVFSSTVALHDHLVSCGNKTEQCQTCHRFIRRAIFNYHADNNCANVDETDASPTPPRIRHKHPRSRNSNRETFRMNTNNMEKQENDIVQNASTYSTKPNITNRTPRLIPRISPITVECEYCHNRIAQNDYRLHQDNCLQNPTFVNNRKQFLQPRKSNRNQLLPLIGECDILCTPVYIPCKFCKKTIERSNYSTHSQDCRRQYKRRTERRVQRISRQLATESIPCEFCMMLYSANQLASHQMNCPQNPRNTPPIRTSVRRRYLTSLPLPPIITPRPDENSLTPSPISRASSQASMFNPTPVVHPKESIVRFNNNRERQTSAHNVRFDNDTRNDLDRNHPSNRLRNDNSRSNTRASISQSLERRVASNTRFFESRYTYRNDVTYENVAALSQKYRLSDKKTMVPQLSRSIIFNNQQEEFRPTPMGSQLSPNAQNSIYLPHAVLNTGQNQNSIDNDLSNRLRSSANVSYNESRRKNRRTRSRRHRSRHIRTRNENNIEEYQF